MVSLSFLFVASITISMTSSQTTLCVWNSVDDWDGINGEYQKQSGTHNGFPFWKQVPTPAPTGAPCPQTPHYIFAAIFYIELNTYYYFWSIYSSKEEQLIYESANCDDRWLGYIFPSNPSQCKRGYRKHEANPYSDYDYSVQDLPLTITDGHCPSLPCTQIIITNSGHSQCDTTFFVDNTNLFVSDTNIYFLFNHYIFKWVCSDQIADWTDCDGELDPLAAAQNDGWQDVALGSSITIPFSDGNQLTLQCKQTTASPTNPPTSNTLDPTLTPSQIPTLAPTLDPTALPTFNPSQIPSLVPTVVPSIRPLSTTVVLSSSTDSNILNTSSNDHTPQHLDQKDSDPWLFLYISLSVITVCILALCAMCFRLQRKAKQDVEAMRTVHKVRSISVDMGVKSEELKAEDMVVNDKYIDNIADDEVKPDSGEEASKVNMWLQHVVELPQYYPLFVNNGFETMKFIKDITDISILKELGIESVEHRQRIMNRLHDVPVLQLTEDGMPDASVLLTDEDAASGEVAHEDGVKIAQAFVSEL